MSADARPGKRHVDLRIATYNIHRSRGMDRRVVPSRIAEVLRDIDADAIALQEVVGAGPTGSGQAEEIGAALGMGWVMAPVRHLRRHLFGNVIMSRFPILHQAQYDLSWRTCEPRGCQRADLDLGDGRILHMFNVHLGTAVLERRYPRAHSARCSRASTSSRTCAAAGRTPASSRSCTSITSITKGRSTSAASSSRARAGR
jgi:endonuclease/exonuclease/phosphatase family metal-dependent hydrolase